MTVLSNMQLELLKLYSHNISDKELEDIKILIGNYFAEQAADLIDKDWAQKK